MQLKEIKYLFFDELVNLQPDELLHGVVSDKLYNDLMFIGLPQKVFGKFIVDLNWNTEFKNIQLMKSNISDIYIGINPSVENIVCYSQYADDCIVNIDYESFVKCHFSYELFRRQILIPQKLGAYYDNSETGGNFEKYACLLEDLLKDIDDRATKEGVWHSLIEEMKLGVI
jgi:hypothetical protein